MRFRRHWVIEFVVLSLVASGIAAWYFELLPSSWTQAAPALFAEKRQPIDVDFPADSGSAWADPSGNGPRDSTGQQGAESVISKQALARALTPLLDRDLLGPRTSVLVTDLAAGPEVGPEASPDTGLDAGRVVFQRGPSTLTPASTLKLMTGTAALEALGPDTRFTTKVSYAPGRHPTGAGVLSLVGGGDPYLVSTPRLAEGLFPRSATLVELAKESARQLTDRGVTKVRLRLDDTLFAGPSISPDWLPKYLPVEVTPISALWIDKGRGITKYTPSPTQQAGKIFARLLAAEGIEIQGKPKVAAEPTGAEQVATRSSASVAEIVEEMLAISDNRAAEVLARHIGAAAGGEPTFLSGAAAVQEVLAGLGVDTSKNLTYDGSGLSRKNVVTTESLVQTLQVAASSDHPRLRAVLSGIPIAGFTGSLQWRFDEGPQDALGRVRAKTGTLSGVNGLAGVVDTRDGSHMAFAIVADRVAEGRGIFAQAQLDKIAGAIGACRCRVGSRS